MKKPKTEADLRVYVLETVVEGLRESLNEEIRANAALREQVAALERQISVDMGRG